jgi:indole-3-glycerol phosphate synthase
MSLRTTAGILAEIVAHKRTEIEPLFPRKQELQAKAEQNRTAHRRFAHALREHVPAVIAEVKKASPSKGLLQPDFHPARIAAAYQEGGAACLSVLTDAKYFQGSLDDLESARNATRLPVLRKDFTIDPVQIYEAAAYGADAILLIAAVLEIRQLRDFRQLATELGLTALVEVHNMEELDCALQSGAEVIGVNNRNLETFEVSLDTSLRLSKQMPAEVLRVSESGIFTRADIQLLQGAGFHAFLIGESLVKAGDPAAALRALLG